MHPAAQITAVAVAGAVALVAILRRTHLSLRAGPLMAEISEQVRQINNAVNHVAPGEPALVERVRHLEASVGEIVTHGRRHREWTTAALVAIASRVGVELDPLPPIPDRGGTERMSP